MRKPDPAYVVDLGNRLLRAKAEVGHLQTEWDTLFGSTADPSALQNEALKAPSMSTRILEFLDSHIAVPYTSAEVAIELDLKPQSTVSTLSKLVKRGLIAKFAREKYISLKSAPETSESSESVPWEGVR